MLYLSPTVAIRGRPVPMRKDLPDPWDTSKEVDEQYTRGCFTGANPRASEEELIDTFEDGAIGLLAAVTRKEEEEEAEW